MDAFTSDVWRNLDKMRYVLAVADTESFSHAAIKLKMSQPALSRSVANVEDLLGFKIFDRTSNGIKPTEQGLKVLSFGAEISKVVDGAVARYKRENTSERKLVIGTKDPFAIHIWPQFLSWLAKSTEPDLAKIAANSDLTIDRRNHKLIQLLDSAKANLLISPGVELREDTKSYLLFETPFRFFAGAGVKTKIQDPRSVTLFLYRDAIVNEGHVLSEYIRKAPGYRIVNVQSFDSARELAASGLGICLIPEWLALDQLRSRRLIPLTGGDELLTEKIPLSRVFAVCSDERGSDSDEVRIARALRRFCAERFSVR